MLYKCSTLIFSQMSGSQLCQHNLFNRMSFPTQLKYQLLHILNFYKYLELFLLHWTIGPLLLHYHIAQLHYLWNDLIPSKTSSLTIKKKKKHREQHSCEAESWTNLQSHYLKSGKYKTSLGWCLLACMFQKAIWHDKCKNYRSAKFCTLGGCGTSFKIFIKCK